MQARERNTQGFTRIHPSLLQVDTIPPFDVFLWPDSSPLPVLYRSGSLPFLQENRCNLQKLAAEGIFARADEEQSLLRYVEENLDKILSDPMLPLKQKAEALYRSSLMLAEEVLERPDNPENFRRSQGIVRNTMSYILQGRDAFHQLLSLTSHDYYTYTHSVNVCTIGLALAAEAGVCGGDELMDFGVGALFHDIGKTMIDHGIIRKRGPLCEAEWQEMKRHPELGLTLLDPGWDFPEGGRAVVLEHHEWVDGSGYPDGKKGDSIHPFAKVAAIADVFDALTTRRSYKAAVGSYPALVVMKDELGAHFEPEYFRAFVRLLGK